MKQLYYSIQTLIRGRGSNAIKVLSLTMGLAIGVLLFSQIVYEFSYENFYRQPERVALLRMKHVRQGVPDKGYDLSTYMPAANDLSEALPDLVESSSCVIDFYRPDIYREDTKLEKVQPLFADTLFFHTIGLDVLQGDPRELAAPNMAFISRGMARQLFGEENPVGKMLSINHNSELTIRGVYQDVPGNTIFPQNLVISLPTADYFFGRGTWVNNDIYSVLFRLKREEDIQAMNDRVQRAVEKYTETDKNGLKTEFSIIPLREVYRSWPDVMRRIIIMGVLGLSIFFVSTMNYVLISVASFSRRAKAVAVHKCNGADDGDVLSMFLWETVLIIFGSILLCLLLLLNLQTGIEDLLHVRLEELFAWRNLWVVALTVVILFLISGFLPGRMFSNVPVTQVFRRYTDGKRTWKRSLLFIEFIGVAFILGVLWVTVSQYRSLMNRDIGFHSGSLAMVQVLSDEVKGLDGALRRQPFIKEAFRSSHFILAHYSTTPLLDAKGEVISPLHYMYCEKEYPQMMGLTLIEGSWPQCDGDVLIGETVMKKLKWTDGAVGKKLSTDNNRLFGNEVGGTVADVAKDVRNMSFFMEQTSVAYIASAQDNRHLRVYNARLKEPFDENLRRLNRFVKESYPQVPVEFVSVRHIQEDIYQDTYRFRNIVVVTSVCILLIVLMGLIGYVNDETQRRSKEIAIRKVNGAQIGNILRLLAWDIVKVAAGAILIGTICASYVSGIWMEQFADMEPFGWSGFAGIALCVLLLIIMCVVLKAWRIASENPVNSIKTE